MSTWKKYKLRELCSEIIDCVNKTAPISDTPTQYKMLRTSDVRGGFINLENLNCVSEETFEKWSRRGKLQKGDVILTREAPLGEVGLVRQADNYFLGQRLVLYRANPNLCDGRFMMYALLYDENKQAIVGKGNGATVHHLRIPDCETIEIKAPDLPTQKRIADILSAYDDLIENNQRQIKLLEEAAMRLYREWFVFMRFPGHESVRIEDGVPEGWEKIRTSSVMKFNYGKGLLEANRSGDGYPVFGSSGIVGYHDTPLVNENCIVVGRKGNVGSVYLSLMPSYPIDTVFYIIPEINIYYCYFELKSRTFVNNDSAVPGLNRENVEDMPMLLPSDKILEGFHNLIDPYIQRMSYLEQQNVLLQKARDALL
ncbi:MAG: restriction endonuclease subunit S, partial [Methanocorpusculaceae archaeon]|nr:restriction endonuclease subunit S [Methanocorpusculaceae archaeon]